MIFDLDQCQKQIGYVFKDSMLLRQCFTHASYARENNCADNELLEFFGDSVIQLIVTEYLFNGTYGDEGKLTEYRKDLVSRKPLHRVMEKLNLIPLVLLGRGLNLTATHEEKLYSSVYEALVAGIYIDGGMKCAKKFVMNTLIKDYERERAKKTKKKSQEQNSKSELQEYVQKLKLGSIAYESLSKSGPDHLPEFREAVTLNGAKLAEGKGKSKQAAQMQAAIKALQKLIKQGGKSN